MLQANGPKALGHWLGPVVLPVPSSPWSFSPQHQAELSAAAIAQVKGLPPLTCQNERGLAAARTALGSECAGLVGAAGSL